MSHFFQNPVRVGLSNIIPKRDCKYLGVTLDTTLTWRQHIKKTGLYANAYLHMHFYILAIFTGFSIFY